MFLKSIALLLPAVAAVAQQPSTAPPPRFDVVSVKPSGPNSVRGSEGGPGSKDPTHYRYQRATLKDFIATAYHVDYFQISSKIPLDHESFDIVANLAEQSTRPQFRLMMQSMLEERFHLKAHVESRDFPAYEMVIAKSGLKLKESGEGAPAGSPETRKAPAEEGFPDLPPGKPGLISNHSMNGGYLLVRTRAQREPISVLLPMLQTPGQEPVVDRTGLTGKYDFTLEYTGDMPGARHDEAQPPIAPSLFTALQQQLGLQLVAKKLPFDVVVVEAIERTPTDN